MPFAQRAAAAVVAGSLALAGCGSGYTYATRAHPQLIYQTSANGSVGLAKVNAASTFFKVPPGWRLLDENSFLNATGALAGQTPEQAYLTRHKQRIQAFDASPKPAPAHVLSPGNTSPTGFSAVYVLDDSERDSINLKSLRNAIIPVDPDPTSGTSNTEVLLQDDKVSRPGGFHGNREVFNLTTTDGPLMTVDKTTLIDKDSRVVYLFVIGCDSACFHRQQKTISQVVDSWTIKER
jgi:hypothetical protein